MKDIKAPGLTGRRNSAGVIEMPDVETIESARSFWTKIALPDYEEFQANPSSLRKAFHAVSSLYHVADWVWGDYETKRTLIFDAESVDRLRNYLIDKECADFKLIRDVADSTKHFRLTRPSAMGFSATNVIFESKGSVGDSPFGTVPFGGMSEVVVEFPIRTYRLAAIIKNVHDMWQRLFREQRW